MNKILNIVLLSILVLFSNNMMAQNSKRKFKHPTSEYIKPENVQYQRDFKAEGKNWTMYFYDGIKKFRDEKNFVAQVYLVPEDYKAVILYGSEENEPPKIQGLVYHDIGEKEFIGAIVKERTSYSSVRYHFITREVKLPDEIANELTGLMLGKTNFKCSDRLSKCLSAVKTPDLAPAVTE